MNYIQNIFFDFNTESVSEKVPIWAASLQLILTTASFSNRNPSKAPDTFLTNIAQAFSMSSSCGYLKAVTCIQNREELWPNTYGMKRLRTIMQQEALGWRNRIASLRVEGSFFEKKIGRWKYWMNCNLRSTEVNEDVAYGRQDVPHSFAGPGAGRLPRCEDAHPIFTEPASVDGKRLR